MYVIHRAPNCQEGGGTQVRPFARRCVAQRQLFLPSHYFILEGAEIHILYANYMENSDGAAPARRLVTQADTDFYITGATNEGEGNQSWSKMF